MIRFSCIGKNSRARQKVVVFLGWVSLVAIPFCSASQGREITTPRIKNPKTLKLTLQKIDSIEVLTNKIRSIEVLDARDDSSSLGYITKGTAAGRDPRAKLLVTEGSLSDHLRQWISGFLRADSLDNSAFDLFIVIRHLRLSTAFGRSAKSKELSDERIDDFSDIGVYLKADIFTKKDKFIYPAIRYDSILTSGSFLYNGISDKFTYAVETMCRKISMVNLARTLRAPQKSIKDAHDFYLRKKHPILWQTPRPGAYANYTEFLENRPSISIDSLNQLLSVDSTALKKRRIATRAFNIWGACSQEKLYIHSGGFFSELVRTGNTFYTLANKNLTPIYDDGFFPNQDLNLLSRFTSTGFFDGAVMNYLEFVKFYQLNMDNGKLF